MKTDDGVWVEKWAGWPSQLCLDAGGGEGEQSHPAAPSAMLAFLRFEHGSISGVYKYRSSQGGRGEMERDDI